MNAAHPTRRRCLVKNSRQLYQSQDGYFLFFKFRMATISKATLTIRLKSSYVLIIITPSGRYSDRVRARPPAPLAKHIILSWFSLLLILLNISHIICLTREPKAGCGQPPENMILLKSSALLYQSEGATFCVWC